MDDDEKSNDEKPKKGISDALRKALAAGVGAVFLTEEGIRQTVSDMKLPKEALHFLLSQGDSARKEMFQVVSKEVKKYLRSSDMERLLSGILEHFTVEVKAEIRFKTKDGKIGLNVVKTEIDTKKS